MPAKRTAPGDASLRGRSASRGKAGETPSAPAKKRKKLAEEPGVSLAGLGSSSTDSPTAGGSGLSSSDCEDLKGSAAADGARGTSRPSTMELREEGCAVRASAIEGDRTKAILHAVERLKRKYTASGREEAVQSLYDWYASAKGMPLLVVFFGGEARDFFWCYFDRFSAACPSSRHKSKLLRHKKLRTGRDRRARRWSHAISFAR